MSPLDTVSIKRLSEEAGINYSSLHRYMSGNAPIEFMPLWMAMKICKALGCTPQDLMDSASPVDSIKWKEGWNDLPGIQVLMEDDHIIKGIKKGQEVFPYSPIHSNGYENCSGMTLEQFKRMSRRDRLIWKPAE